MARFGRRPLSALYQLLSGRGLSKRLSILYGIFDRPLANLDVRTPRCDRSTRTVQRARPRSCHHPMDLSREKETARHITYQAETQRTRLSCHPSGEYELVDGGLDRRRNRDLADVFQHTSRAGLPFGKVSP